MRGWCTSIHPYQRAILGYYAWKHGRDRTDILRKLITQYALADKSFDAQEFKRYIMREVVPDYGDDKEMAKELRKQVADFLKRLGL